MAREFGKIHLTIWSDDDFRDLTPRAQHLYLLLVSHPSLTYAGVADWRPGRLAAMARGWTGDDVESAAKELSEHPQCYLVIDEDTEEVLLRSFIRHDGILKQPKTALAMVSAWAGTASKLLRGVIVHEVQRLHEESPGLPAFVSTATASGERLRDMISRHGIDPSGNPSRNPTGNPTGNPNRDPSGNPSGSTKTETATHNSNSSTSDAADAAPDDENDPPDRPEVEHLCAVLADLIEANGSKRPQITKRWRDSARRMIDIDARDPVKAEELIRWALTDDFWAANIGSMPTFRDKYDQLRLKAIEHWRRQQRTGQPGLYAVNGSSAIDPARAEDMRRNPHKYR